MDDYRATIRVTLPVGLIRVQNSHAAVFASCADEKLVTLIDFSLGTIMLGYKTNGSPVHLFLTRNRYSVMHRIYNILTRYIMALVESVFYQNLSALHKMQ